MPKDPQKPSMHLAYAMRKKARKMAKGGKVKRDENVKGVHQTNYEDPGHSMAGTYVRAAKEGAPNKKELIAHAKKEHETILKELREMKKPMLYAKGGPACADCAKGVCMAHGGEVGMYAEGGWTEGGAMKAVGGHSESGMTKERDSGMSFAGQHVRGAAMAKKKGQMKAYKSRMDSAKNLHKQNIEEMRSSPKPKIPMAQGGIVDRAMQKYSQGGKVANKTTMAADMHENQFDDLVLDDDLDFEYTGANSGDHLGNAREDHDRKDIVARIMRSRAKKDRMPRPA